MLYPTPSNPITFFVAENVTREKEMSHWWQRVSPGAVFEEKQGGQVVIFHPGRKNYNDGPDFLNACISYGGRIYQGDVELHLNEKGWFEHGHHHQPRYGDVVLHVVSQINKKIQLPYLTIQMPIHKGKHQQFCEIDPSKGEPEIHYNILQQGIAEWRKKVASFLSKKHTFQFFYFQESMAVFGSGENKRLFRQLAQTIWSLNHVRYSDWVSKFSDMGSRINWHHSGVMPKAYPEKRLQGLSELSYDIFLSGPTKDSLSCLKNKFKKAGFSKGIFTEWLGNVHLPILAAFDSEQENNYFKDWMALYIPAPYGRIDRQFKDWFPRKMLKSFPISQGLLALQTQFCDLGNCHLCLFKRGRK